ncbi:triple R motif-containing [Podarcis lilfordi]|uniref:Triple QxxK/R motif-containing protein n=2 Tax=Podarcis TaxID=42163 RepID=A0AA35PAY1_9SAUR|nr:triple R motif-containing [Podarcis lilfordi]
MPYGKPLLEIRRVSVMQFAISQDSPFLRVNIYTYQGCTEVPHTCRRCTLSTPPDGSLEPKGMGISIPLCIHPHLFINIAQKTQSSETHKKMGRKDSSSARAPVEQHRKQIGKQDYKKTRPMLKATRLKAEAKKTAPGMKEVSLILGAILVFLVACYAFFYLNLSEEVDLELDQDEN